MKKTKKSVLFWLSMIVWLSAQASVNAQPANLQSDQATKNAVSETHKQTSIQASTKTSAGLSDQTTKSTTAKESKVDEMKAAARNSSTSNRTSFTSAGK